MRYAIYDQGEVINYIEADEAFCADYCAERGYTYGEEPLPEVPAPEPEPTLEERVTSLETAIAEGLNLYEGDLGNG